MNLVSKSFGNWHGLLAPKGTPDKIVRTLHKEIVRIRGHSTPVTGPNDER